jgi:rod shape determining protein RodA
MRELDFFLIALVVITAIFGIVVISSAVNNFDNNIRYIIVQSVGLLLGLIVIAFVLWVDYEYFGNASKVLFVFMILALVVVLLVGSGRDEFGPKRWIRLGSFGIQPSEVVKVAFIITFSKHLSTVKQDINNVKNIVLLFIHAAVPTVLIALQPDLGTALVFIFILVGMLFVSGIKYKYIVYAASMLAVFAPIAWFFILKEYQQLRIKVFLNPEMDPMGSGYHAIQSRIAVGAGSLFGEGLFRGTQTQLGYLPEKHTDFIFAVIGEELGLVGSIFVFFLLLSIIYRCISTAQIAKNDFGSYLCIGVAFMLIFQTFENIGMCIGLTPVTGIPLPFMSYGPSSLITNLSAVAIVLNVRMRRKVINF